MNGIRLDHYIGIEMSAWLVTMAMDEFDDHFWNGLGELAFRDEELALDLTGNLDAPL